MHCDFLDVSFSGEFTVFDKAIVFSEVGLRIEHNFDIVMHTLPSDLSLVTQVFTIDAHDLATVVLGLSGARSSSVDDFNLASAHVGVLAFVSLDATSFLSISKHASNSCKFVNLGVADPSNIDQAVVHCSEWIYDHTTTGILSVTHHEQRCVEMLLVFRDGHLLVVDEQIVVVSQEVALAC